MTLTIVASIYSYVYNNTWYQKLNTYITFSKKLIFLPPEWDVNSISDPQLQIGLDQGNWKSYVKIVSYSIPLWLMRLYAKFAEGLLM